MAPFSILLKYTVVYGLIDLPYIEDTIKLARVNSAHTPTSLKIVAVGGGVAFDVIVLIYK